VGKKQTVSASAQLRDHPLVPTLDGPGISIMLPVDAIDPNLWNPRRFPRLPDPEDESLTASIARHGVQLNLLVRPAANGRHELVFGERRLRCAKAAGRTEVPVVVRDLDDHAARVLTLTENLHRKPLLFLEEADAVGGLVDENWTLHEVAAELGKKLTWVARRRRLLNLSPAWRKLAEKREGWTASWSDADFEQIALLERDAQDDLLARDRHRLERCTSARELARLIRSLARCVSSFPWSLDDADLHPPAGPCSSCPLRSSRHPGLFDEQERTADPLDRATRQQRSSSAKPADRCLSPLCAKKKEELFLERRAAQLALQHPQVLRLQEGWLPRDIPGALRDDQVIAAKKGSPGAPPAVVQNGANLGRVKWVQLPSQRRPDRTVTRDADATPGRKSLAERQEQKWRRRKVHAIALLKTALLAQAPPPLSTSVRLAVAFGTANTNSSSHCAYDLGLPVLTPATDVARELRRILGIEATEDLAPARQPSAGMTDASDAAESSGSDDTRASDTSAIAALADAEDEIEPPCESTSLGTPPAAPNQSLAPELAYRAGAAPFWRTFDALDGNDGACTAFLWARTLRVMLVRMTPDGNPRHVDGAWYEAQRVAGLAGLDAQAFLDQATEALPDPKCWAKEKTSHEAPLAGAVKTAEDPSNGAASRKAVPRSRARRQAPQTHSRQATG
jgi:ParB/RepB/Spo0J family partition protein